MACGLTEAEVLALIAGAGGVAFANPSGLIGLSAVNGVAATAERSDSCHALSQAIAPRWTGIHIFDNAVVGFRVGGSINFFGIPTYISIPGGEHISYAGFASNGAPRIFQRVGIPANTFGDGGRRMKLSMRGTFANNANAKTISVVYDGVLLASITNGNAAVTFTFDTEVWDTGSGNELIVFSTYSDILTTPIVQNNFINTVNLAASHFIDFIIDAAANDILANVAYSEMSL